MTDNSHAYNTVWQLRGDAWCRLEEAAERLRGRRRPGEAQGASTPPICSDLLPLTPLEPYWAYPGAPQFASMQRLFAAGQYDKFARTGIADQPRADHGFVSSGECRHAGLDEQRHVSRRSPPARAAARGQREQLYFEVLVVETMTEAQERALRKEVRSWRRPDDEFVYELVVVSSGDEALIAAG